MTHRQPRSIPWLAWFIASNLLGSDQRITNTGRWQYLGEAGWDRSTHGKIG